MEFKSKIEEKWIKMAKMANKTIVLPEASFSERIVKAGIECAKNNICEVVFLTDNDKAFDGYDLENYSNIRVINYKTHELKGVLADALYIKRKEKGMTKIDAINSILDPVYFGTTMVDLGLADGLVAGAEISTLKTFKPALQIIKGKTPNEKISSFFIMLKNVNNLDKIFLLSDCGMNINPSCDEIVGICKQTAKSARELAFIEPKVALLSYSTFGSAEGDSAIKMKMAVEKLKQEQVDFIFDGEMQLDSAIDSNVSKLKCPRSRIQGDANVFIFPDLASGNIGYKLMQRFGEYRAIGPISQGMRMPINDVSRGATVSEIVNTIIITVLQN